MLPLLLAAFAVALAAGPGAGAPSLTLAPAEARPGDAVLVEVAGAAAEAPRGALGDRPLAFWRAGDRWRALTALPIETAAGGMPARVELGGATLEATLTVVEPGFAARALTLPPKFVEPPASVKDRMAADREAFARAFDRPFEPPLFSGAFALPRDAAKSGRYGDQRVLNGKTESVHYGLDLRGPRGAPVAASNDGVVALVRDGYLAGNAVVVWHGAGVFTIYFHLDRVEVRAGQRVRRGERLGRLGSTGRSSGPHLHWGVKIDGLYVDPESLLRLAF
jgi:murein DD-endopeptidase MepM/ murein hydrolase activator NlpD